MNAGWFRSLSCVLFVVAEIFVFTQLANAGLLPDHPGIGSSLQNLKSRSRLYLPCQDSSVKSFVGLERSQAFSKVKSLHLLSFRSLDPLSFVTYEVNPDRLTLVIDRTGIVVRAFCR